MAKWTNLFIYSKQLQKRPNCNPGFTLPQPKFTHGSYINDVTALEVGVNNFVTTVITMEGGESKISKILGGHLWTTPYYHLMTLLLNF